jgi:hypothetical protein
MVRMPTICPKPKYSSICVTMPEGHELVNVELSTSTAAQTVR